VRALNAIPGITCVPPAGAFYAMPQVTLAPGDTDERYILELLRATGVLCVYGSGFGMPQGDGFFRVVFLANPADLTTIYASIDSFTRSFLGA
jgi:alanine-synthesizing transaminase